jgi:hypothetical protein
VILARSFLSVHEANTYPSHIDDSPLTNKKHHSVLESLQTRISKTLAFLQLFKIGIEYDLVPISDVYGPTAWDPDVQALVVSKETLSGASSSKYSHVTHCSVLMRDLSRETSQGERSASIRTICDRCDRPGWF